MTKTAARSLAWAWLLLSAATASLPAQSSTLMISAAAAGGEGNGDSVFTAISEDGSFVAFASLATNLLPTNDSNGTRRDVFLRDVKSSTTILISKSSSGEQANDTSSFPSMSSDAKMIAFETEATNLIPLDANLDARDVYVHDRMAKVTSLVSVSSLLEQANGPSESPHISSDGRFVTFLSSATNLASGSVDANGASKDVFLRDTKTETTSIISIDSAGAQDPSPLRLGATHAVVSKDGRLVAFATDAKLIGNDANDTSDIYLRDVPSGTTAVLSRALPGGAAGKSNFPAMDPAGKVVVFESAAGSLVDGATGPTSRVYAVELESGSIRIVSKSRLGAIADGPSFLPSISPDGSWISFVSSAENLVSPDNNELNDVFLHELASGFTTRISVGNGVVEGNALAETGFFGVSRSGAVVAFRSKATNLLDPIDPGQTTTPGRAHVYIRTTRPDTFPPVVQCGSDILLECEGDGASVASYPLKFFDDSDPAPVLVCDPPPGTTFPPGSTKVTCTVTDASRNSASCSFQVTVADTTPPAITCPPNVSRNLPAGQTQMKVDYAAPVAADSCGKSPQVVCTPASGSIFPMGTTKVSCTAKDVGNLTSRCEFQVTVIEGTPPVVTCPAPIEIECAGGGGRNVAFTASATDDTDPSPVLVCTPSSGSFFPVGATKVTCTAKDSAGNVGTCVTEVRVRDTTPPTITCPGDIEELCSSAAGRSVDYVVAAADGCDTSPRLVCTPASGSTFPQGDTRVMCTATDVSGNTRTCSFNVRISSDQPLFYRGDSNRDDRITISDPVFTLLALFLGEEPPTCHDAADVDDNGVLNVTDPIYLLRHMFQGGPAVPPPGTETLGPDPTPDTLDCSDPVC